MKINVITGLSGAGKSTLLDAFEDMGVFCIDNMPPKLLEPFIELYGTENPNREIAVVMDLRLGEFFRDLNEVLSDIRKKGHLINIYFLDASDKVLLNRFKSARRAHPLEVNGGTLKAINKEREELLDIKENSNFTIDSSKLNIHQLKEKLYKIKEVNTQSIFQVILTSFGFKKGILEEADYVFDIRTLRNPYYDEDIRNLTGLDKKIRDYIFEDENSNTYLEKLKDMLEFVVKLHRDASRHNITIGFGCTGGRHRSVTYAYLMYEHFKALGYDVILEHRDI